MCIVSFLDCSYIFSDNTVSTTLLMTKQNSGSLLSSPRDIIFEEICFNSSAEMKLPSSSNKMLRADHLDVSHHPPKFTSC